MKLDTSKICDIELADIDISDWPDLCDSFISSAWLEISQKEYNKFSRDNIEVSENKGKYYRKLTEEELEWLQENEKDWCYDYIYSHAMDYIL